MEEFVHGEEVVVTFPSGQEVVASIDYRHARPGYKVFLGGRSSASLHLSDGFKFRKADPKLPTKNAAVIEIPGYLPAVLHSEYKLQFWGFVNPLDEKKLDDERVRELAKEHGFTVLFEGVD